MVKDRIKVIRLIPVLDFGGVESRFVLQSTLMDRERFDLRVCTFWKPGEAAQKIQAQGIPVDVLDIDPAVRNPMATLMLWRYLMAQRPDVIHASVAEAMFHGAIAGFLAGVPRRIIEDTGVPGRSAKGNLIYGGIARLVHHVIGVSKATCRYLTEQDRMPAERVKLLYNCGKPDFFEGERPLTTTAPSPFKIFTAGRLVEVKNQMMLIEAMRVLVHERGLDVHLDIAGEGVLKASLQEAIDSHDLGAHVTLMGFRSDVRALIDAHDLFVIPSHSEGCSIALIEAMATGIPVLGSTADGVVEVMGKLGDAFVIEARDTHGWVEAIEAMITREPEARRALGERGRQIAHDEFSPTRYINALETLYAQGVLE
jgi:glycosyltransferase involved in cell wall biosynthesis